MKRTAAIVLMALGTAPASAADDQRAALIGAGATACAEYLQAFRTSGMDAEAVFFSWAQGFMSALNLIHMERKEPLYDLGAVSVPEQGARLRKLCAEKPLVPYAYAVEDLMKTFPELPPR